MTIEEFCDFHGACREGRKWAIDNCSTMLEVWNTARPGWLLWVATRRGVLTDRELRLFAVWCARQVQHLMADERSVAALDVAERYATGEATELELDAARVAATVAARAAVGDPAMAAGWAAARAAAADPATAAAMAAAMAADAEATAAARAAAGDPAMDKDAACWSACWFAACAAQADHLRATCIPRFTRVEEQVEVTP